MNEAQTVATRCKSGTQGGKNGRSKSKEVKNKEKEEEVVVVNSSQWAVTLHTRTKGRQKSAMPRLCSPGTEASEIETGPARA